MLLYFGKFPIVQNKDSKKGKKDCLYNKFDICDIHTHKTGNVLLSLDTTAAGRVRKVVFRKFKCHSVGAVTVVGVKPKPSLKLVTATVDNRIQMNQTSYLLLTFTTL